MQSRVLSLSLSLFSSGISLVCADKMIQQAEQGRPVEAWGINTEDYAHVVKHHRSQTLRTSNSYHAFMTAAPSLKCPPFSASITSDHIELNATILSVEYDFPFYWFSICNLLCCFENVFTLNAQSHISTSRYTTAVKSKAFLEKERNCTKLKRVKIVCLFWDASLFNAVRSSTSFTKSFVKNI